MTASAIFSSGRRILLKLSGEMLLDAQPFGIDPRACERLAQAIKLLHSANFEIGVVIGGGNIFRGINFKSSVIDRTPADYIGMLSTLMNGIALQQALGNLGCSAKLLTALECPKIAETYTWRGALDCLKAGVIAIFVGGTGNPYFTTDTAAALRASEIHANVLMKATKVNGVYNKDPLKHSDAIRYGKISYSQMLAEKLEVMDATSVALCRSNRIPILVFNMKVLLGNDPASALLKQDIGTLISGD